MQTDHGATVLALLLALLLGGACREAPLPPEPGAAEPEGRIEPRAEPEEPLLELGYKGGMIANPDPTPFVRVYPGGRVLIHYPAYMKKAGDYTLQLSDEEVQEYLGSFASEDVLTLDPQRLEALAAEVTAQQPVPLSDSHGVEAVLRIRGESFTPESATQPTIRGIDQTFRASSEALVVAPKSASPSFRSLAAGIQRLEALAERDDLRPVEAE